MPNCNGHILSHEVEGFSIDQPGFDVEQAIVARSGEHIAHAALVEFLHQSLKAAVLFEKAADGGLQRPDGYAGFGWSVALLLLVCILLGVVKAQWFSAGARWLLAEMLLFFVPAVVAVVNYQELLLQGGTYRRLWERQQAEQQLQATS